MTGAGPHHPHSGPRPPALSRRILRWTGGRLGTPELASDASDLFAARVADRGERSARRWYRRQARAALGRLGMAGWERLRAAGGPSWSAGFPIDVKLGARMLVTYPGVALVGGLAMTIGIGLGAAYLEVVNDVLHPTLPLEDGERLVGLRNWDTASNEPELRSSFDFVRWRSELEQVEGLGAYRSVDRNVGAGSGPGEPAVGAEITPSAFTMLRVPAMMGRTLLPSDEEEGAEPVIVLGFDLWRDRFFADPEVVGRTVRMGRLATTVVGVMPPGFAFPVSHEFWMPLRLEEGMYGPRLGPGVQVFGRLAEGASLEVAQAELAAAGLRVAREHPDTHERLRPQVMKYTELFVGGEGSGQAYLVELAFVLLLLVLGSNVATMVFARTATRENEIAMRFALGASRGQILVQFFVEALVLALAAMVFALGLVRWGAGWLTSFFWEITDGRVPFWMDERLNATTVLYALGLAVLGALVAGVMPTVKATTSRLQDRLRHAAGTQGSSMRLGGLWNGLIVVQVALAVLVLPPAIVSVFALAEPGYVDPGFNGGEYLSAQLEMDDPPAAPGEAVASPTDFEATYEELERRLLAEPGVSRVTFATRLPVMNHPQPSIQVEELRESAGVPASTWVMPTSVEPGFFDAFGAEITSGRGFSTADMGSDTRVVIVNDHFVEDVLEGRNAVGRRIRYSTRYGEQAATGQPRGRTRTFMLEPGEWYEIVGVVRGLGMDTNRDPFYPGRGPGVYHPLTGGALESGGSYAVRTAFHVQGDAASFAPRLRELAHAVDPELRLRDVLPLDGPVDAGNRHERITARFFSWATALVAVIALLISVAGTYAVMSFTVSRQTREIGIRIALGADRRRIVTGVFSRSMFHVAIGLILGAGTWFYVIVYRLGGEDRIGLLIATAAVLMLVGFVACGVPVRRALRIEPTEALKEVG